MKLKRFFVAVLVIYLTFGVLTVGASAATSSGKLDAPVVTASNAPATGKISLSWDAVEGASSYRIYRANSKTGSYTRVYTTSNNTYTNAATVAGSTYYYYVVAVASDGTVSDASAIVKRTCDLPRPTITLSNVESTGKIKITWEAVQDAVSYKLYSSTDGKSWILLKNTTGTSLTHSSAVTGKTYYYRLMAVSNVSGANSAYSNVKSRACDLARPTISSVGNSAASGKITVSWKAVDGAQSYKVYRASSQNGTYSVVGTTEQTTFTNTSTVAGKTYYYKIKAIAADTDANSAFSKVKSGTCDLPRPSLTLTNVAATGKVKISWDAVNGAVSYKLYCSTDNASWSLLKTTTATSIVHSSGVAGTTYYYKVKAIASNSEANSAYSNVKSKACTLIPPVITAVGNSESSGKITLSWGAVNGAVEYKIYRSTSKNGTYAVVGTTSETSFTNSSAVAGAAYYYKVRAVPANSSAYSDFSQTVRQVCDLPRPTLTLTNVASSGKTKISWDAIDGAVSYELYCSDDGESWSLLKNTAATSYINTAAAAGVTYYYKLVAIAENSEADSAYSKVKSKLCDLARPVVKVSNEETTGRVQLTWNHVDGAIKYKVYRSETENGTYTGLMTTTDTSYVDTSGAAETAYYYKVLAIASNTSANSAYSAAEMGTYEYRSSLQVYGELNSSGKPRLTWNAVKGAADYAVYRATSQNGEYRLISATQDTALNHNSAACGVTYYYQVIARNAKGTSIYESDIISMTSALPEGEKLKNRYVNDVKIAVYEYPDSTSEMTVITYMENVQLGLEVSESSTGSWYRLFYNEKLYYVWMTPDSEKLTAEQREFAYTGNTRLQQDVIDLALEINSWDTFYTNDQSTGIPNEDGTYGFDCSGLATYILNTVMQKYVPTYRLNKNISAFQTTEGIYNEGYPGAFAAYDVELEDIQPGDVIFFSQDSEYDHCGIYLGNNEFIHCASLWDSVRIMPLSDIYLEDFACVRRYLPEEVESADTTMYLNISGVYLYAERDDESEVLHEFKKGEAVTVLFTNNRDWAYVRTEDGTQAYMLVKYLTA